MITIDAQSFERTLSAAFVGGERSTRELRLSQEEAAYLRARYPQAGLTAMAAGGDEKTWYKITLPSPTA